VSLIALLLAWVYIFDTVQRERELLEGPKESIIGAGGLQDPSQVAHTTTVFPPDREDSSKAKDEETGEMSGQAVNIPPQMLVDSADGRSIGDMYAPMQGNISILEAVLCCTLLLPWAAVFGSAATVRFLLVLLCAFLLCCFMLLQHCLQTHTSSPCAAFAQALGTASPQQPAVVIYHIRHM